MSRNNIVLSSIFLAGLCGVFYGIPSIATLISYGNGVFHWREIFTVAVIIATIIILATERLPPHIAMLSGAVVLLISGIVAPVEFFRGFSKDVIFTLSMLFIVARALDINGVIRSIAARIFTTSKHYSVQLLSLMIPLSIISAFLNNTPIVLMLTPIVRKWAIDNKRYPSRFLIPLSYAAILGGACTLIGTSSNIIIDGLIRAENPAARLSFFELSHIGVPCAIIGITYMAVLGKKLLPRRSDPLKDIEKEVYELTGEFVVGVSCPLVGLTIKKARVQYFNRSLLIEIERNGDTIESPLLDERIRGGDILVFEGEIGDIAQLHSIKGLISRADAHFKLDISSSHFSELVISKTSLWVGSTLQEVWLRSLYDGIVLAIYRHGKRLDGTVSDRELHIGDVLMVLSNKSWPDNFDYTNDFFYIRHTEKLSLVSKKRSFFVFGVLAAMVTAASCGVTMLLASFCAAAVLVVSKSISIGDVRKSIRWNILILVGSAFSFGMALEKSGVAHSIAKQLLPIVHGNQYLLIAVIFLMTMIITEVVTNNAAVLLLFPIAVQLARQSGFDSAEAIKAVGISVALASSYSFCTPIGYQTNIIIYGPGGYRFTDYTKVGVLLSAAVYIVSVTLIPQLWPLA